MWASSRPRWKVTTQRGTQLTYGSEKQAQAHYQRLIKKGEAATIEKTSGKTSVRR